MKNKNLEKIALKYGPYINDIEDLYGDEDPSKYFYLLSNIFSYLLNEDSSLAVNNVGSKIRQTLNKFIKLAGPYFLKTNQVIENRNLLKDINSLEKDEGIILPKEPVIWASTHRYPKDALSTLLSALVI